MSTALTTKQTDVAERLRLLQAKNDLTIQEMADRCGLPKRSLENYMNLKNPQRPGLDALVRIADGLATSVDWIVGRGEPDDDLYFTTEDYAYFCHVAVSGILLEVLDAYKRDPAQAIDPGNDLVLGHEVYDLSTVGMLEFLDHVRVQHELSHQPRGYFRRHFRAKVKELQEGATVRSFAELSKRKP